MRCSAFITVLATALSLEAQVRFGEPTPLPDLGLSCPLPLDMHGDPISMPKADSYLVTSATGARRLEDRFDVWDLWTCHVVRGRWRDDAGNILTIAQLSALPPNDQPGVTRTRADFFERLRAPDPDNVSHRDEMACACSPVELKHAVKPRRAKRRNLSALFYYYTADESAIAYAFRVNESWYLAVLQLMSGENFNAASAAFDSDFLDNVTALPPPKPQKNAKKAKSTKRPSPDNQQLTLDAYCRLVVNYSNWHYASDTNSTIAVVDDLDGLNRTSFIPSLTSTLPKLRAEYTKRIPSPLEGTNSIAAVRVFRDRQEYLSFVGVEAKWTGAIFSPTHREIVMYLPQSGVGELMHTIAHEAFHQYLAYAGAMVSSPPWFNEGHAILFEHSHFDSKGTIVFDKDVEAAMWVQANADLLAENIPALLEMDYMPREGENENFGFYAGTDEERLAHYRLAWSIAYFLEIGAPNVRFRPFEKVRQNLMEALVRTRNGRSATSAALDGELRSDLIDEWRAFWKKQ